MIDGYPRPDHGDGWQERVCNTCNASWVGHQADGGWCPWCERRAALDLEAARRSLLTPTHLQTDQGTTRYDQLTHIDQTIWDQTRGRYRGTDTIAMWVNRLADAVAGGWITEHEADAAIRRVSRHDRVHI